MMWLNRFIVEHQKALRNAIIVIMASWFVGGLILVDILHPLLFIGIWAPIGALFSFFAYKW